MDVASFGIGMVSLVLQLSATFTAPTAPTRRQIALGWVLYRKPAVVTDIIRILGDLADRTWTICHKFLYRAAWQLRMLCRQLLIHAVGPMIHEAGQVDGRTDRLVVDLNIDDTTAARYGNHVAHAHWFEDASANGPAQNGTVIHWANNWLMDAVTLRLPGWPKMRLLLAVLSALYRKPADCDKPHPFRT